MNKASSGKQDWLKLSKTVYIVRLITLYVVSFKGLILYLIFQTLNFVLVAKIFANHSVLVTSEVTLSITHVLR